jgi:hypothetical protein
MTEKEVPEQSPGTTGVEQIPGTVKQASEEGDRPDTAENVGTVKEASEEGDTPDVPENTGDVKQADEEGASLVDPPA